MPSHVIEFDEKCKSCEGTGLYVGMAERDGAAIVCYKCKGTGRCHVKIEYEDPPTDPIEKDGIKQVYETNPGIGIGTGDGCFNLSDFGGITYEEWRAGIPFPPGSEMRSFVCPKRWCQSAAKYGYGPKWDECFSSLGKRFSECNFFAEKDKCWERWDKEQISGGGA